MSELPSQDTPPEQQPPFTRREFLRWGAGSVVVGGVAAGTFLGARPVYEAFEKWRGRSDTEALFGDIMTSSHKFMIYDGLLQVDRQATVADSIFGHASSREDWSQDGFVLAVRPIAVHGTLLRNVADYSRGTQNGVDRVLSEVHPRLMAFYDPNDSGKLVYLDADANGGLVTPLSASAPATSSYAHLPVSDINIEGRELRDDIIYPYTKDLYRDFRTGKIVEQYHFIGQSTTATTVDDLNRIAGNYFFGNEPLAFPSA